MSNLKNTPISKLFEKKIIQVCRSDADSPFSWGGLYKACVLFFLDWFCMILVNFTNQEIFTNSFLPTFFGRNFCLGGRLMSLRLAHLGDLGTSWRIETGDLDVKILSSRWCTYQMVERNNGSIHAKLYPDFCGTNMTQDRFPFSFPVKQSFCWSSGWISFQTWPKYVGCIKEKGHQQNWGGLWTIEDILWASIVSTLYRSILYM